MRTLKTYLLLTGIFLLHLPALRAQDPHYTQAHRIPAWYNPAAAGHGVEHIRLTLLYRNQWASVSSPFKTQGLFFDKQVSRVGFGANLVNNSAGDAGIRQLFLNGQLSYRFSFGKHQLASGVQVGFIQKSFDPSKMSFDDQYTPDQGFNPANPTSESFSYTKLTRPDFGTGLMWTWGEAGKDMFMPYGGISLQHINQPKESFIEDNNLIPRKVTAQAGVGIHLNEAIVVTPMMMYAQQLFARELMGGVVVKLPTEGRSNVEGGILFRNKDAIALYAGYQWNSFMLGMSYDANISGLTGGPGAFELTFTYIPKAKVKKEPEKKKEKDKKPAAAPKKPSSTKSTVPVTDVRQSKAGAPAVPAPKEKAPSAAPATGHHQKPAGVQTPKPAPAAAGKPASAATKSAAEGTAARSGTPLPMDKLEPRGAPSGIPVPQQTPELRTLPVPGPTPLPPAINDDPAEMMSVPENRMTVAVPVLQAEPQKKTLTDKTGLPLATPDAETATATPPPAETMTPAKVLGIANNRVVAPLQAEPQRSPIGQHPGIPHNTEETPELKQAAPVVAPAPAPVPPPAEPADADQDGIIDSRDACPFMKGSALTGGCPDTDGDGITDMDDRCPLKSGDPDRGGCPEEKTTPAPGTAISLHFGNIEFKSSNAEVHGIYKLDVIEPALDSLLDNDQLILIITGHTDSEGDARFNMNLSQARADAVRDIFIRKGLEEGRITTVAYGENMPLLNNASEEGKKHNRRVEVHVIRRK